MPPLLLTYAAVYSTAQHEQGRRWLLEQGVPHSLLSRAITRFPHILIYRRALGPGLGWAGLRVP